ncbi:hypothetical protein F5X96DRAFT_667571 [Biscogniauxia mediterranea]|nr:hypothetical protein F5X96DRAFT_667571 [Biscogniauxia mediterranea]
MTGKFENLQPSDDPNDPINWLLWHGALITFILSLTAIFAIPLRLTLAANTLTHSVPPIRSSGGGNGRSTWSPSSARASLVAVFLSCPETAFGRDVVLYADIPSIAPPPPLLATDPTRETNPSHGAMILVKKIFAQSLVLFGERKADESFLRLLVRPLPLFLHQTTSWACFVWRTLIR